MNICATARLFEAGAINDPGPEIIPTDLFSSIRTDGAGIARQQARWGWYLGASATLEAFPMDIQSLDGVRSVRNRIVLSSFIERGPARNEPHQGRKVARRKSRKATIFCGTWLRWARIAKIGRSSGW